MGNCTSTEQRNFNQDCQRDKRIEGMVCDHRMMVVTYLVRRHCVHFGFKRFPLDLIPTTGKFM